jgi:spermidine synthase
VEKATLCEIDRAVIDLSLRHYPEIAGGAFDDKRADIVIADGLEYVAETDERFDAIIVDSSEPIGPSAVLHKREFFADCKRALKAGGVLITQNGLPFLFPEHLAQTSEIFASLFKATLPYLCTQPCYFGGPFALNWASDDKDLLEVPESTLARRMGKRGIAGRYYTAAVHRAAFALPAYVQAAIGSDAPSKARSKAARSVAGPRGARKG